MASGIQNYFCDSIIEYKFLIFLTGIAERVFVIPMCIKWVKRCDEQNHHITKTIIILTFFQCCLVYRSFIVTTFPNKKVFPIPAFCEGSGSNMRTASDSFIVLQLRIPCRSPLS